MNLEEPSQENISFMINQITEKLQVVNAGALQGENFDVKDYDDIKDIYEMVETKDNISVNEMDAIVSELGKLKK